jgi:chromosomal replication initiator protein
VTEPACVSAHAPTVREIQATVARRFGVPAQIMREPDGRGARLRKHAQPRQLAMSLSLLMTRHSCVRVGHFFGRDHATVLFARTSINRRMRKDPELVAATRDVLRELRGAL